MALSVCLSATFAPAAAATRPDLVVSGPRAASATATAGGPLTVSAKVKNIGSKGASATKTAFYLSKDTRKSTGDVLLGKKRTTSIPEGGAKTVRLAGTVPGPTKAADYRVLACADAAKQVRESNETNNCKASRATVAVAAASDYDPTPFGEPTPVTVSPTLDPATSVTEAITAQDGGTIQLALPDGTTFTLDVPPGALMSDEDITMTALSDVSGDPFSGGFVTGVKLEPEGLTFIDTAFLTIQPATPIAPSLETPFSAQGSGDGFYLHPIMVEPTDPTFPITHFSLFGLFETSPEERAAQLERSAVDAQAALDQQIQDVVSEVRERQQGEFTDADLDRLYDLGARYYDLVVRPLLIAALNDHTKTSFALQKAISWQRVMELLGMASQVGSRITEMNDLLAKVIVNYADKVFQRCVEQNDLGVVQELISIERTAQLLGITLPGFIHDKIDKCATFELEFTSEIYGSGPADDFSGKVSSVLVFSFGDTQKQAPIAYVYATITGDCPGTLVDSEEGIFQLDDLQMDFNIKWVEDPGDYTREDPVVNLLIMSIPQKPQEMIQRSCQDFVEPSSYWFGYWQFIREQFAAFGTTWNFSGFEKINSDGVIARKELAGTATSGPYQFVEDTVFELRHKPQA